MPRLHWIFPVLAALLAHGGPLRAFPFEGRVTDGRNGLAGVRVHADRTRRPPGKGAATPSVLPEAEGRFGLELEAGDAVLAVEKDGWIRDVAPLPAFLREFVLRPAPEHRVEKAVVIRFELGKSPSPVSDAALRARIFSREPNAGSAANYFYEVSKGALSFEEGIFLRLPLPKGLGHPTDADRETLVSAALGSLRRRDLSDFDRVDNATGEARPDGKPDHLWIIAPGPPRAVTTDPAHLTPLCFLMPLPWKPEAIWPVVLATDESPVGLLVHEAFHAMGEHRADDLYLDCGEPPTAGVWDLMDAGQYRGWDAPEPAKAGWMDGVGYSPSQPGPWVRADLWYRGRFRDTVKTLALQGRAWEGWLEPLARAPGAEPQVLRVPDARGPGRFWELSVRRPWGFDAGRMGGRWGPGREGLIVASVDPSRLSPGAPLGPVRVQDAHPGTAAPDKPRLPCGRHELDDAAFNVGPGEIANGEDGPLQWKVLAADRLGRMKVRVRLAANPL